MRHERRSTQKRRARSDSSFMRRTSSRRFLVQADGALEVPHRLAPQAHHGVPRHRFDTLGLDQFDFQQRQGGILGLPVALWFAMCCGHSTWSR
jgi:hypothetical protein